MKSKKQELLDQIAELQKTVESIDNEESFKDYFLSLIYGSVQTWKDVDLIWSNKDNNKLLVYDRKTKIFYYSYYIIYPKLESKFGYNIQQINELLTPILIEHFNCEVFTTKYTG